MTPNQILAHMIERSPWVNPQQTVDTVKFGDGDREVSTAAVCWYPSLANLEEAARLGCELVVTHEPTWWDHLDKPGGWREKGPGAARTDVLEKHDMVVIRLHDTWDNWPKIGVRDSLAKGLGFETFLEEDESRYHAVYEVPEQTLRSFAGYVAKKVAPLGEDAVQVIGDPDMKVRRPSIGVGCGGPKEDMIQRGSDVLIMCFDGASYWRDRERFAAQGVGVITLEHGTTEMWGIESLARYIGQTWSDLSVYYVDRHPRAWHVSAGNAE